MPLVTDRHWFYHCPRTGGTWVRGVFDALGIAYRIEGYHHSTPADVPPQGCAFTIAREPEAWLASWRALVDRNPHWAWPVPDWLLNAETVEDAETVMRRYSDGCEHVLHTETLRDDLQRLLGVEIP